MKKLHKKLIFALLLFSLPSLGNCKFCEGLREGGCCYTTRTHGKGASGKWIDTETAKRGWTISRAFDLGPGMTRQCEMCEREMVRFVHRLFHPEHGGRTHCLEVGCICAGHMTGRLDTPDDVAADIERAEEHVRRLTSNAARRENFPTLAGWRHNPDTNTYSIRTRRTTAMEPHNIDIVQEGRVFRAFINGEDTEGLFTSLMQAKVGVARILYPDFLEH